ncbi:hypothetical protein GCM10027169_24270 [Gordonia jinhuaensis]
MHDGEQGDSPLRGVFAQPCEGVGVQCDACRFAAAAGGLRARAVQRQRQFLAEFGQGTLPVARTARSRTGGIVDITGMLGLGQRIVGVLHRVVGESRRRPLPPGLVGRHQVGGECGEGAAVGGDVMDHRDEDHITAGVGIGVPAGVLGHDIEDGCPEGLVLGEVERSAGQILYPPVDVGGIDRLHGNGPAARRVDGLDRGTVDHRESGAQHLVAIDHVVDRGGEHRQIDCAAQPQRERQIVGRRVGLVLVEEPQSFLIARQRYPVGPGVRQGQLHRPSGFVTA